MVHRSDSSGTNFLFTNALAAQCGSEFGPASETDATLTLYEFPWSDRRVATSQCPALPFRGSNQVNWPDLTNDQCSNPIPNPAGGTFVGASGNSGVVATIGSTNGAIGYSTSDYVKPVVPGGLNTANLQAQYDIDNGTGTFTPPTPQSSSIAMQSASPVFDDTTRLNPLNWSAQAVAPNPTLPGAYPIAGFSFINVYQCYADANVASFVPEVLRWLYADGISANIIQAAGFAVPPSNWLQEIQKLVWGANGVGQAGVGACAGKSGA